MQQVTNSYVRFEAVTLSDTVDLPGGTSDAIYVGTKGSTGTIVVIAPNGFTTTFVGVAAGTLLPIRVKRVNTTTTDASNLVACYLTPARTAYGD